MARRQLNRTAGLALAAAFLVTAGCAPLEGSPGGIVVPNRSSTIVEGEIRSVDTRRGRLELRDSRGTRTLRYDHQTSVVYGQRRYPVSALERGDYARIHVSYDRHGNGWADRVEVRRSARDDRGIAGAIGASRVAGTVGRIDHRRGFFTVERGRDPRVTVYVPSRLSRDDARRFDRLRRGDRVRVEVRQLRGRNEAELVRFR
jgi:hypothetical protein